MRHVQAYFRGCLKFFALAGLAALTARASTNLVWQAGNGFRFAALSVSTNGHSGFTLLNASQTGITFSNVLSDASIATNRLLEIGSGVALGDIDGDGWVDVCFC